MEINVWRCPWCGEIAEQETRPRTLSESRTCTCGAVGLTVPVRDSDEIIDDAIDIFGVRIRETSRGFDDLILADLTQSGVEVRGGALTGLPGGLPSHRWMWFRRTPGKLSSPGSVAHYVFLSYVREDRETVDRLCESLRERGIQVWLDRDQIKPGQRWQDAIRDAIHAGAFFLACFSEASGNRTRSYQNEEITLAIDELRKRPTDRAWFIPICLSPNAVPKRSIGGGEDLTSLQWVDLYTNWEQGVRQILEVVAPRASDRA